MVSLDDPENPDNPFPGEKDVHGLLNKKGYLKHHGFWQNPFVKVKGFSSRKAYKYGAHSLLASKKRLRDILRRIIGLKAMRS